MNEIFFRLECPMFRLTHNQVSPDTQSYRCMIKGCSLRMFATFIGCIEDDGDYNLNEELHFKKYFFATAISGSHSKDTEPSLLNHSIMKDIDKIEENHSRFRLNFGFDD